MKSLHNVTDIQQAILSPNKDASTRIGLYLSCWPKGSYGNLQTTLAVAKTISCSPQTSDKKTPTQCIEYGEVKLVPTKSFHSCVLESLPHFLKYRENPHLIHIKK